MEVWVWGRVYFRVLEGAELQDLREELSRSHKGKKKKIITPRACKNGEKALRKDPEEEAV